MPKTNNVGNSENNANSNEKLVEKDVSKGVGDLLTISEAVMEKIEYPKAKAILGITSKIHEGITTYDAQVKEGDTHPGQTTMLKMGVKQGISIIPVVSTVITVADMAGEPLQKLGQDGLKNAQSNLNEAIQERGWQKFPGCDEEMRDALLVKTAGDILQGISKGTETSVNIVVEKLNNGIDSVKEGIKNTAEFIQRPMPEVMPDKAPNILVNDTHLSLSATDRSTPGNNSQTINQLIDPWDYNLATSNSKSHNINQHIDSLDSNYTTPSDKLSYSDSNLKKQPIVKNKVGAGEFLIKTPAPIQKNQSTSSRNKIIIESDPRTGTTSFKTNTATQGNGGANIVLELTPHVITIGVGGALDTATLATIATTGATVGTVAVVAGATYLGMEAVYANSKYPSEKITPLSENVIETNIQEIQENHGVTISDETKEKVAELFQKENIYKINAKNNHNRAKRHKHKKIIGKISKTGGKITGNKKLKELGERYSSKNVKENLANEKMEIDLAAESKNEIIHIIENEKSQLQSIQEDKNVERNTDASNQISTIENSVNNSNNQKFPNEPNNNEVGSQEYQKNENNNLHVGDKRHRDIEHDVLKGDILNKKIKNDITMLEERYAANTSQKYVRNRFFHKANSIVENEKIPNEIAKTLGENTLNNNGINNNNLNMQVQQTFFNEVRRVDIDDPDILRAATPLAAIGAGVYLGNAIAPDDKLQNLIDQNLSKAESAVGVVGQVTGMAVGATAGCVAGGMAGAGIGTGIAVGVGFGVAAVFGVAAAPVVAPALLLFGVTGVIGGGKWGMAGGMVAGGNIGGKVGDTTSSTISSLWNSLPSLW